MKRIFLTTSLQEGLVCTLPNDAYHHVVRVLRCGDGEKLCLFNGDGYDYFATLQIENKKTASVCVHESVPNTNESPLHTLLIQAISKGDRMDWVMQKAVELGVNAIWPVRTAFCAVKLDGERLEKKHAHWQSVMISACEQSGRAVVPILRPVTTLENALKEVKTDVKLILHPYPAKENEPIDTQSPQSATVLVGPEGGFSEIEVTHAITQKFSPIILGKRILRTETAALSALALCQQRWGDWYVS